VLRIVRRGHRRRRKREDDDGEKTIIVPPTAEIVTYKTASAAALKPGQKIFVAAAKKLPDGILQAPNVAFGDYGVWR
jgi:hypothetical protein